MNVMRFRTFKSYRYTEYLGLRERVLIATFAAVQNVDICTLQCLANYGMDYCATRKRLALFI